MKKDRKSPGQPSRSNQKEALVSDDLVLKVEPFVPNLATVERVSSALIKNSSVQAYLKRTRHQLLSFDLLDASVKSRSRPALPNKYRATFYDYTHNRAILVDGYLNRPNSVQISESGSQPLPSQKEFDAALKILQNDRDLGSAIREKRLQPYPPMPPLIEDVLLDGRVERTIAVGLLPTGEGGRNEIVGVNMIRQAVRRFENRAPEGTSANDATCGLPNADQSTTGRSYVPGQVWVTVTQGGTVLWKFLAIRPAASSGMNGSGVELRFVDYRGKRVLYRAHVPLLNVKYDAGSGCDCFRDWQNEEGMIQATGTDIAPGFRLCSTPASTILDTGSDTGNFLGVAIYVKGQEVVLVSEMEAGWYRYVSEWRLHANGTIRPRFGFSAVNTSSCVCNRHHHHPYWRFDFDIRTPGNNRVREYNNPPLFPPSNWHTKHFEIKRSRDPARGRKWRVENTVTGEGYDVIPGPDDGVAMTSPDWPFPNGDIWILRYRGTELDDGVPFLGSCEVELDRFVNGEPIDNQDVVIWYAAHVTHDITAEPPGTFGHIAGPTLEPFNW